MVLKLGSFSYYGNAQQERMHAGGRGELGGSYCIWHRGRKRTLIMQERVWSLFETHVGPSKMCCKLITCRMPRLKTDLLWSFVT